MENTVNSDLQNAARDAAEITSGNVSEMTPVSKKTRGKLAPKTKRTIKKVILFVVMLALAFVAIAPFYWSVLIAFRPQNEIYTNRSWFPTSVTLEHFKSVFENVSIFRYFGNTVIVTLINIVTNLVLGSMAAYGFAKLPFKGSKLVFKIMMLSMMLPGIATMVPTFLLLRSFPLLGGNGITGSGGSGVLGTFAGVLLPGTVGVYGIFFLRQFLLPVSNEYAEAARIDGAGELRIYATVYLPMILPALMTLGIFCFQGVWNSFMWPNLILQGHPEKSMLTMALRTFSLQINFRYGPMMAMSLLMSIPIIALFCYLQKYFISGVAIGGIKG